MSENYDRFIKATVNAPDVVPKLGDLLEDHESFRAFCAELKLNALFVSRQINANHHRHERVLQAIREFAKLTAPKALFREFRDALKRCHLRVPDLERMAADEATEYDEVLPVSKRTCAQTADAAPRLASPAPLTAMPNDGAKKWQSIDLHSLTSNVSSPRHGLGPTGRDLFVEKKVKDFVPHLPKTANFKFALLACWSRDAYNIFHDLRLNVEHRFNPNASGRAFNADKPELYSFDDQLFVLRVSPGADYMRVYAQSFWYHFSAQEQFRGRVTFGAFRSADSWHSFEHPAQAKFCAETGLDKLKELVSGAIVVLGSVSGLQRVLEQSSSRDNWTVDGDVSKPLSGTDQWGWQCRKAKNGERKILLLGTKLTYWGNLAYTLTLALCELGASGVFHVGVKVGSRIGRLRHRHHAPVNFVLGQSDGGSHAVTNVKNALATHTTSEGIHMSVPSPLDETCEYITNWQETCSIVTIDDEGAYIALAAEKYERLFGALYFVSDYVFADHPESVGAENDALGAVKSDAVKTKEMEMFVHLHNSVANYLLAIERIDQPQ
jgi:hypothetical protein